MAGNEDYEIVETAPKVYSEGANKLKLQMATRLAIMNIQSKFMAQQIEKDKETITDMSNAIQSDMPEDEKKKIEAKISSLQDEVEFKELTSQEFGLNIQKVRNLGVKLLKLPIENLNELGKAFELGVSVSNADRIFNRSQEIINDTSDQNKSLFSNIDSEAIRQDVKDALAMNDKKEDEADHKVSDSVIDIVDNAKEADKSSALDKALDIIESGAHEVREEKDKTWGVDDPEFVDFVDDKESALEDNIDFVDDSEFEEIMKATEACRKEKEEADKKLAQLAKEAKEVENQRLEKEHEADEMKHKALLARNNYVANAKKNLEEMREGLKQANEQAVILSTNIDNDKKQIASSEQSIESSKETIERIASLSR